MKRKYECEVTTANGHKFLVEYDSIMEGKDDSFKALCIIKKVFFVGYELALGQLREKLIWGELVAAVDNNAIHQWDVYWAQHDLLQVPTLERQDNDHVHPVFKEIFGDVFGALGDIFKPKN